jgi:hypothetical protein
MGQTVRVSPLVQVPQVLPDWSQEANLVTRSLQIYGIIRGASIAPSNLIRSLSLQLRSAF